MICWKDLTLNFFRTWHSPRKIHRRIYLSWTDRMMRRTYSSMTIMTTYSPIWTVQQTPQAWTILMQIISIWLKLLPLAIPKLMVDNHSAKSELAMKYVNRIINLQAISATLSTTRSGFSATLLTKRGMRRRGCYLQLNNLINFAKEGFQIVFAVKHKVSWAQQTQWPIHRDFHRQLLIKLLINAKLVRNVSGNHFSRTEHLLIHFFSPCSFMYLPGIFGCVLSAGGSTSFPVMAERYKLLLYQSKLGLLNVAYNSKREGGGISWYVLYHRRFEADFPQTSGTFVSTLYVQYSDALWWPPSQQS